MYGDVVSLGLAAGGGEEQASGVAKSAVQEAHGDEHGIGAVAVVVLQPQLQRVGVGGRELLLFDFV
ncbi:hypothetical protein ACH4D4_28725 [Streptomyces pristinaespiralis]|uniref:hypothetical protein n=1 Tax=Streptomyces pristinaespiralis TaxID=38300 RepID=UPI0037A61A56